jgi:ketosteroid isomerase-like protein
MSYSVPRSLVESFYKAYAARDLAKVAEFLDDDVEWSISGPVGLLRFCGMRHGKAAALDMMMKRQVPEVFDVVSFVSDVMVVDGDRVATLNRLSVRIGDRIVSYRLAHCMRFRDGKVVENLSLIDSFNAVAQVFGQPLAVQDYSAADLGGHAAPAAALGCCGPLKARGA